MNWSYITSVLYNNTYTPRNIHTVHVFLFQFYCGWWSTLLIHILQGHFLGNRTSAKEGGNPDAIDTSIVNPRALSITGFNLNPNMDK